MSGGAKARSAKEAGAALPRDGADARAQTFRLEDDGVIPNHPTWPLLLYPAAVPLSDASDAAAAFEGLFQRNGWVASWRNGIYAYTHYHSQIHEALGIARGFAKVQFGGVRGPIIEVSAGDVAVLPAGTGHKRIEASDDFLVVGAYPPDGRYDLCTRQADRERALTTIAKTPRPATDPVFGGAGPLIDAWA
jgi:uncharacterized protein YjlB